MSTRDDKPLGERLAVLETTMLEVQHDVKDILVTIQGPPRADSIRGRLHRLEQSEAAATAATAAIEAAKELRQAADARSFSRKEKLALAVFGAVTSACTVITTVAVLAHHHI